jgi:hypothetical protein
VTTADTESGVDLGVSTLRDLLSEVSASSSHQVLAANRTKHAVLQGFSPSIQLPAELATDLRDGAAIRRHGPFAGAPGMGDCLGVKVPWRKRWC